MPTSDVARIELRNAAWPCRLAQLRCQGVYLPANLIRLYHVHTGWLVTQETGDGEWLATMYTSINEQRAPYPPLSEVRTVRQNDDGTYLLQGLAWDAGYLQRWEQDWICGPVDGANTVMAAVEKMDGWLKKRYTGKYGR